MQSIKYQPKAHKFIIKHYFSATCFDPVESSSGPPRNRSKVIKVHSALRWENGVMDDARMLGERNWRNAARNRDNWQKLLKKALAQSGLLCQ
jgi:hypothetical protein